MRRFVVCALAGLFMIAAFTAPTRVLASVRPTLSVEGEPFATTEGPLEMVDEEVFVPLRVFVSAFGAQLRWLSDEQGYLVTMGDTDVRLSVGRRNVFVGGRGFELKHAPQVMNGQTMIPLELVVRFFPVLATWNAKTGRLDLRRLVNEIVSVSAGLNGQGRPVVAVDSRDDMATYQLVEDLCRANRVVIDFFGMKPAAGLIGRNVDNPLVRSLRIERPSANRTRLVVDLVRPSAYEVVAFPGETRHLEIHFDYALRDVRVVDDEGWPRVLLDVGKGAEYRQFTLKNPDRLVIDLADTVLVFNKTSIPGDNRLVKMVRMSQMEKRTTRVVLDLVAPRSYHVSRVPAGGALAADFPKKVTSASWADGALVFEGEAALNPKVATMFSADGAFLDVSLANAEFADGVTVQGSDPSVTQVTLSNGHDGTARVRLSLAQYGGYRLTAGEGHRAKLQLLPSVLAGMTIAVDAGHGGHDPGAASAGGLREKDINLDVATRLMWRLRAAGAKVVMTRSDDTFIGLYDRPKIANEAQAAAFVSIHSNLHPTDPLVRGIETYHHPDKEDSARLAQVIHAELLRMSGLYNRGVKKRADFVVVRETQMPSLLLEIGFLSNAGEAQLLATLSYHDLVADAVLNGLFLYFGPGEIRNPEATKPTAPNPPPSTP